MMQKTTILIGCLAGLGVPAALAFSSDSSSLTRNLDKRMALTNSAIVVTATFTNGGATDLRGFFYSDEVPSGLAVATLGVSINGMSVTNYTYETGQNGDVYAGCRPYRWILERPAGFTETNPIPSQAVVQISYSIGSSAAGDFSFQPFSWVAYDPGSTNALFGYAEDADLETIDFFTTTNDAYVAGTCSTNGFVVSVDGWPGNTYAVETSTNLLNWVSLATNALPFAFSDTNAVGSRVRFFRARLVR